SVRRGVICRRVRQDCGRLQHQRGEQCSCGCAQQPGMKWRGLKWPGVKWPRLKSAEMRRPEIKVIRPPRLALFFAIFQVVLPDWRGDSQSGHAMVNFEYA